MITAREMAEEGMKPAIPDFATEEIMKTIMKNRIQIL